MKKIKRAVSRLRALDNGMRLRILKLIIQKGPMCVTDITVLARKPQVYISQHLRVLKDADIVNADRHGKNVIYSINYSEYNRIKRAVVNFVRS